jgi:hypothetical protein
MTVDNAVALAPSPLDIKTLLTRINTRIALLRTWMSHDHGDEPYWWARRTRANLVQYERGVLRAIANLLHVERATQRGRILVTRFATLDEQRAWIAAEEERYWPSAEKFLGTPSYASLVSLREGKLPL